ncbi:hypothetical protein VTN31DRAFT_6427 [Thermomyces dupontii]|uniref:uncharacterized protein n=1 Tax=Talaromyces thermophilus TaxID=28565 RepID=UPI003743A2B3
MASLSEEELKLIRDHPLNHSLDALIEALREADQAYSFADSGSEDRSGHLGSLLSDLIYALSRSRVALCLHSRISGRNLTSELLDTCKRVLENDFSYDHYRPLVKLVVEKAVDVEIWSSVLELISKTSRVTPQPTSAPHLVDNTSIKNNSGSLQGSEQTRSQVDLRVFQEIQDLHVSQRAGILREVFRE